MKHRLLFFLCAFCLPTFSQPWSSFLDPSRAIDWTNVGFSIPNYTTNCATQPSLTADDPTAAAANTTAIQNALASCDATHNVVNIPAGTYYLAGWTYGSQGKQVVRGAGPMSTTVHLTDMVGCGGLWLGICMINAGPVGVGSPAVLPPAGSQQCSWTAGYAKGTTTITLAGCGGAPPLNQMLILDQANDTSDTGGIYICDVETPGCTVEGNYNQDGRVIGGVTHSEQQVVYTTGVTSLGGGSYSVTISPGIYFNNIRPGQSPGAWWPGTVQNDGLESVTVYHDSFYLNVASTTGFVAGNYVKGGTSGATAYIVWIGGSNLYCTAEEGKFQTSETIQQTATRGGTPTGAQSVNNSGYSQYPQNTAITMFGCYQCWVRNVRSINAGRDHVLLNQTLGGTVVSSYFYEGQTHGTMSYGIELERASATLIENNIFQQITNAIILGQGSGSVFGYNYATYEGFEKPDGSLATIAQTVSLAHNAGNGMNLWEGNNFLGLWSDISFGANAASTLFRNQLRGWQNGNLSATWPLLLRSWQRVFNAIGNVWGQPGYHNTYEAYGTSSTGGVNESLANTSIYILGFSGQDLSGGCAAPLVCDDPAVRKTLMRWGNYDTVTSGVKWDPTEASPGAVPYVNANFTSLYFSSLAHTLPASLYYTSKPSWWPATKAWPPVGPDVSSGNLGICSGTYAGAEATSSGQCTGGTLTSAWASHAASIPAQDCYLNVMNGSPDGTGNVLNFDANLCYASSSTGPTPPSNLAVKIH